MLLYSHFVINKCSKDAKPLFSLTFFWTDKQNKELNVLQEFAHAIWDRSHLVKMVGKFMVVNDTDKRIMVMRLYQVFTSSSVNNLIRYYYRYAQKSNSIRDIPMSNDLLKIFKQLKGLILVTIRNRSF